MAPVCLPGRRRRVHSLGSESCRWRGAPCRAGACPTSDGRDEQRMKRALLQKSSMVALVKDGLVGDFPLSFRAPELFHALQIS